jgi:hypothetical protein
MIGKLIPIGVALQREDRRLAARQQREDQARRKLLPLIVIVCETYRVSTEDLLDSRNLHPTVVQARDIVRWLGYHRLHVGNTYMATALSQHRTGSARDFLPRIRAKYEKSAAFRQAVGVVEKLLDAAVKR